MARDLLTHAKIRSIGTPGRYSDGDGLMLHVRPAAKGNLRKNWVLRYRLNGKRVDAGLGSYPEIDLPVARQMRDELRKSLALGIDAKDARDEAAKKERLAFLAAREIPTFEEMTHLAYVKVKADLKNEGKNTRWMSPLENHVLPKIGHLRVTDITRQILVDTLEPIWKTKSETAVKAMDRIGIILRFADNAEYDVDVRAAIRAKGSMATIRRGSPGIPAMSWADVPAFYKSLNSGSPTHLGLRLLILTAARSGELRLCKWEQIEGAVWTVPAENLKTFKANKRVNKSHDIPLSREAISVLDQARLVSRGSEWVFPTKIKDAPLSNMAWSSLMKKRDLEARPHGFRSSFRIFIAEQMPEIPPHIAEMCLGHAVAGAVERAYQRSDLIELRRPVMDAWGDHVAPAPAEVVQLHGDDGAA